MRQRKEDRKLYGVTERKDYFGRWEPMAPDLAKHTTQQRPAGTESREFYPKFPGPVETGREERPPEKEDWVSRIMRIGFGIKF